MADCSDRDTFERLHYCRDGTPAGLRILLGDQLAIDDNVITPQGRGDERRAQIG